MNRSFVLNLGNSIEWDSDGAQKLSLNNDIVIKGYINVAGAGESVEEASIYLNRADILKFLNEIMEMDPPKTSLGFTDVADSEELYCEIRLPRG